MRRQLKQVTVVTKGSVAERTETKTFYLRRRAFGRAVTNDAVRAGIRRREALVRSSA
jgi:hypothetical protein